MKNRSHSFCLMRRPVLSTLPLLLLCLASSVLAAGEKPAKFGYDNGFFFREGDRSLRLSGYINSLWTGEFADESTTTNEFRVRRGRFVAAGSINDALRFNMHVDFTSARPLLNYFLDYRLRPSLTLRMGQCKTPFARQFLVLATQKQFVDDTIATSAFKLDRDIGLMIRGPLGNGWAVYQLGAFNGAGKNARQDNTDLMYVARLALSPLGPAKLTESDISAADDPRLSIGAAVAYNTLEADSTAVGRLSLAADLSFFYRGFSAVTELFRRREDPQIGGEITAAGEYLQAGYMLLPPRWEIAARIARVRADVDIDNADRRETGLALNRFFEGHPLKLQFAYTSLVDGVPGGKDQQTHRVRLQFQAMY